MADCFGNESEKGSEEGGGAEDGIGSVAIFLGSTGQGFDLSDQQQAEEIEEIIALVH